MPKPTPPDPSAIRREIEAERARIADTIAALAYRADVPARVKEDVADRIAAARRSIFGTQPGEAPAAAAALEAGEAGDDAAMLTVESAADLVEAYDGGATGFGRSAARYVSRNRLLVAIGAVACFVAFVLAVAARGRDPKGSDAAA